MVERSNGVRQSQFEELTSITPGSYFGFFFGGYNYKITYANFIDGLGVTGTIEQAGDVTGTPVLDVQGTVNYIRNLEAGAGIDLGISVDNGITISHNFTIDSTGEPLVQDAGDPSPTVVSLVAGTGILLETSGATVVITSVDAVSYAAATMQGNSTATVIAATSTPVKAAGTFVAGAALNFTVDATGRITHTGTASRHVVNAIVTLDVASGSNHVISLYIAKNGTVLPETKMSDTVSSGLVRSIATFINTDMNPTDYFEIFVRNESTTDDITVVNAMLSAI